MILSVAAGVLVWVFLVVRFLEFLKIFRDFLAFLQIFREALREGLSEDLSFGLWKPKLNSHSFKIAAHVWGEA